MRRARLQLPTTNRGERVQGVRRPNEVYTSDLQGKAHRWCRGGCCGCLGYAGAHRRNDTSRASAKVSALSCCQPVHVGPSSLHWRSRARLGKACIWDRCSSESVRAGVTSHMSLRLRVWLNLVPSARLAEICLLASTPVGRNSSRRLSSSQTVFRVRRIPEVRAHSPQTTQGGRPLLQRQAAEIRMGHVLGVGHGGHQAVGLRAEGVARSSVQVEGLSLGRARGATCRHSEEARRPSPCWLKPLRYFTASRGPAGDARLGVRSASPPTSGDVQCLAHTLSAAPLLILSNANCVERMAPRH